MNEDWQRANALLQDLQQELPSAGLDRELVHEIGNALAISQANIEAVRDGVLEPTPERLSNVRAALNEAQRRLRSR